MTAVATAPASDGIELNETGLTANERHLQREWLRLVTQGDRTEIVGGQLIVSPWTRRISGQCVHRLTAQLWSVATEQGWEFYQTWSVYIPGNGDTRLPDLLVAPPDCPEHDHMRAHGPGVLLVCEVVSEGSRQDDLGDRPHDKPQKYASAGIPVYLVIDPADDGQSVTLFTDPREGRYRTRKEAAKGESLALPEPFSTAIDTSALFR